MKRLGDGRAGWHSHVREKSEANAARRTVVTLRLPGPELIVIQCRRHNEKNLVTTEEVKAFWTTMNDDGATRGLYATTSRLESGVRQYCDARHYRLSRAEGDNVAQWIRDMASHAEPTP
ncbi:MAG: restriction endonuclease [Thermoguttaceae bacterium]